jgi:sn-glycerol 3-phosphate transport system permease protein
MAVKLRTRAGPAQASRLDWLELGKHVLLIVACLIIAFPLLAAVIKGSQTGAVVTGASLRLGGYFWSNVQDAWISANLGLYMRNSLIVAVCVTLGKTALSLLAAVAFVYFRFPLRGLMFALVLFSLMLPTEILIVALFDVVTELKWTNTYAAIIVPFLASATGVFLFRQQFMQIPSSLAEAARMDGAGPLRYLWNVLIPLSLNTIGALAVIQFVSAWDQYLWPLVIIRDEAHQVVQVGLKGLSSAAEGQNWGVVMAGAVVTIIPPLIVFTALQEQFSKGFALGTDK